MDVKDFRNKHKGETCVLIGNGPSLDATPLERFKYPTFGSNMIFRRPFIPTYYCLADKEMAEAVSKHKFEVGEAFVRAEFAHLWNAYPLYPIVLNPGFSVEPYNFVVLGGSVSFVILQLAFFMGFKRILMVGMDHNYPKSSQYGRYKFTAEGDDPDHFTPKDGKPYFEDGVVYNPPELRGGEMFYKVAKELFDQAGVECINLTPNSKLDVFRHERMESWYGR